MIGVSVVATDFTLKLEDLALNKRPYGHWKHDIFFVLIVWLMVYLVS